MMQRYRVAGLFSREAGLSVLEALFTPDSEFELVCLFTNRREPTSAHPDRPERPEFASFQAAAQRHAVPFYSVDTYAEAKAMHGLRAHLPFDFIFSVSWAFLVPAEVLALPRLGAINQHRGKLPDYPLAAPVAQALRNGDSTIILSTHLMNEAYDQGQMLVETPHPANYDPSTSFEANVERIKRELLPLYPIALRQAALQLIGISHAQ
jgi:methionyl-tRNA formyltransferase